MVLMIPGVASLKHILLVIITLTLALFVVVLFFYRGEHEADTENSGDLLNTSMPNYINQGEHSGEFSAEDSIEYREGVI